MLTQLDTQNLMILLFVVLVASFFIGSLMNGVMESDGFGAIGNMVVMTSGAFLGFYAVEWLVPFSRDAVTTAVAGVSGGFISLAMLSVLKAGLGRLGF